MYMKNAGYEFCVNIFNIIYIGFELSYSLNLKKYIALLRRNSSYFKTNIRPVNLICSTLLNMTKILSYLRNNIPTTIKYLYFKYQQFKESRINEFWRL